MGDYTNRDYTRRQHDAMKHASRGQTLPLLAVAVLVLLGTAGFAVDVGYHQYQQRMQQTATDSAAVAGAANLATNSWKAAAVQDAKSNGFTDTSGGDHSSCTDRSTVGLVCVQVNNPPVSPDAYSGNSGAVEVQVSVNHPTFLEQAFGIGVVPVTTKAVAAVVYKDSDACVVTLDYGKTANFNGTAGGGSVVAPQCGLVFNGGANFNNSTAETSSLECGASAAGCANGTYPAPYATPQAGYAGDPCPHITYCNYLTTNPPPCSSPSTAPTPDATGTVTVPGGCYNGFKYQNSSSSPNLTVNLCGLYVMTGNANISSTGTGAPAITIQEPPGCAGVTFYMTGSGQINFKNSNVTLYPPSSGDYNEYSSGEQNVLFYQATTDTATGNLLSATCAGCTSNISGMMYFPSANLNYTKGGGTNTGSGALIVSYDLNCNGCDLGVFEAPLGGGISEPTFVLVE